MNSISQAEKLENLIRAAERARVAASHDLLFADRRGLALINAAADLFETDALDTIAEDVKLEISGPAFDAGEPGDPNDAEWRSRASVNALFGRAA